MMNWNNLAEFIAMGGYGLYVWGSFFTVLGLITVELIGLRLRKKAIKQIIKQIIFHSKNSSQHHYSQRKS
jgi:heme exporter protein D